MKINFWSILLFILLLAGTNGYAQSTSQESTSRESAFKKTIFSAPSPNQEFADLPSYGAGEGAGGETVGAPAPINEYQYALMGAGMVIAAYFSSKGRKQKA